MEVLLETTRAFEKDVKRLTSKDQVILRKRLHFLAQVLLSDEQAFYKHTYQPLVIKLMGDLDASLYVLRVNLHLRVILTVDEDPLFDQMILTLLRVVRKTDEMKAYRSVMESLYQGRIAQISEEQSDGTNQSSC